MCVSVCVCVYKTFISTSPGEKSLVNIKIESRYLSNQTLYALDNLYDVLSYDPWKEQLLTNQNE